MRRNVLSFPVLAVLLLVPLSAGAQQSPDMNEVVVTATRIDSPILESPSAISVVTSADIAAAGAHDLSAVIEGQSGTVVNNYGPIGSAKSVSLRGSTSDQVLVLLDGIRLNSGRVSSVDLSTIPADIIDRVEILRGAASTIYGSGAIGGVINIITKKPDTARIDLSITNGSFLPHAATSVTADYSVFPYVYTMTPAASNLMDLLDNQQVELSMAGRLGDAGLTGGGSFVRAANAYTWYDPSQVNGWRRRTNADVLSGNANLGLDLPLLGGTLTARTLLETSNTGAPGSVSYPSTAGRQYDNTATGTVAWKTGRFLRDELSLDVKASYKYDDLQFNDPSAPPASDHRSQTASLDITQRYAALDSLSFIYGGSAYYDYVDSNNYSAPKDRLNLGGFLSVPLTIVEGLTVTPSARYDYFSDFTGSLSFSLSAVLQLSEQSSARASVSSAYRAPALNDLYWYDPLGPSDPFGYTTGNPNLRPETSYSGELGYSLISNGVSVDASVFGRLVYDNIVWLFDPSVSTFGAYLPENLTKTFYPGAELHAKIPLIGALSVEAAYTFVYSFFLNNGTSELTLADNVRVPYAPIHSGRLSLRWEGKVVSAGVEGQYVSDKFTDRADTPAWALHGYFLANADVKVRVTDQVTMSLAGKNLLNTLYYTQGGLNFTGGPVDPGYPMPPFSVEAGMHLHL